MLKMIVELENEIEQVRRTTNLSNDEIHELLNEVLSLAKKLGVTCKDILASLNKVISG